LRIARPLVGIFVHETVARFEAMTDVGTLKTFRQEAEQIQEAVIAEVARDPAVRTKGIEGSLEKDPLCQVCMVISSINSILGGIRELQHSILRSE